MSRVSHAIDRIEVTFDDPNLVANAGLLLVGTLAERLGLEALVNSTVRLVGPVGGARPGRKVMTLVHAIVAGGSHIDHADVLRCRGHRSGAAVPGDGAVDVGHVPAGVHVSVMSASSKPSSARRCGGRGRWAPARGRSRLVIDIDSTICEVDRQGQAGRRVRLHEGARLPPAAGHTGRHRRGAARPDAQRLRQHPARRRPVRRRARRPGAPRRRHRRAGDAGRFGVLVQRHHRQP